MMNLVMNFVPPASSVETNALLALLTLVVDPDATKKRLTELTAASDAARAAISEAEAARAALTEEFDEARKEHHRGLDGQGRRTPGRTATRVALKMRRMQGEGGGFLGGFGGRVDRTTPPIVSMTSWIFSLQNCAYLWCAIAELF
jgi:hypothetical protein